MILTRNSIQKKYLNKKIFKSFSKEVNKIFNNLDINLDVSKTALNVLSKKFKFNFKSQDLKKFKKFKKIAIIGMGGSILGTEAIYYFLKQKIKKEIYFFDNIDTEKLIKFKKLNDTKKTLFLVISKSGNTVETLVNFLSLNLIKKNAKNIIVISEKKNSPLYLLSKKFNLFLVEHKSYIGGRYSVLSEVGMLPAYLFGLNIIQLRKNIRKYFLGKHRSFLKDSSIKLASLIKQKKINNLIFLNYAPKLDKFLFWCQQLIGESLGKKAKGFLPVVSPAPKDHHSLLQLYLDGPKDKLFCFFSAKIKTNNKINSKKYLKNINYLNNKTLETIKDAQRKALIQTFKKHKVPFREFIIKKLDEKTLSELFSYFILETIMIGKLIKVNPFDQPSVEQVKITTKKILK